MKGEYKQEPTMTFQTEYTLELLELKSAVLYPH